MDIDMPSLHNQEINKDFNLNYDFKLDFTLKFIEINELCNESG